MFSRSLTIVLSIGVVYAAATNVLAVPVFENPWNPSSVDNGSFSDPALQNALVSGQLSLVSDANVSRATWRGTMYSPDPLDTGDTWTFDLVFYGDAGGPSGVLATESVIASVTDTGIDRFGERVYEFDALFPAISLSGITTYHLSVVNTSTPSTFRWNVGLDATNPSLLSQDNGTSWTVASTTRRQVNFVLFDEENGVDTVVPEPLSICQGLIGLATISFVIGRRVNHAL